MEFDPNIYFMCLSPLSQSAFIEFQFKFSEHVANLWTVFQILCLFSTKLVLLPMFS